MSYQGTAAVPTLIDVLSTTDPEASPFGVDSVLGRFVALDPTVRLHWLPVTAAPSPGEVMRRVVRDRHHEFGALAVSLPPGQAVTQRHYELADAAADCLLLLHRARHTTAQHGSWVTRHANAQRELREGRSALSIVRVDERRRLVRHIAITTGALLGRLRAGAADLEAAVEAPMQSGNDTTPILVRLAQDVDDLILRLRRIARGTYPQLLRTSGVCAALREMVVELEHPVRIDDAALMSGGWEVQSALFWAVDALLRKLDEAPDPGRRSVSWFRNRGRLGAVITVPGSIPLTARLDELVPDLQRLRALGGSCSASSTGAVASVVIAMPDSLQPRAVVRRD